MNGNGLFAQKRADTMVFLDSLSAKHRSTTIWDDEHHHPVDVKAKGMFDSLRGRG